MKKQALEFANHGRYGLAAMVWTENLKRAHRMAEKLECGIVWVNCWMLRAIYVPPLAELKIREWEGKAKDRK